LEKNATELGLKNSTCGLQIFLFAGLLLLFLFFNFEPGAHHLNFNVNK